MKKTYIEPQVSLLPTEPMELLAGSLQAEGQNNPGMGARYDDFDSEEDD